MGTLSIQEKIQRDRIDKDLMILLKEGDDSALNKIMEYWKTPITSFLFRYTGVHEDAVDLAIETFVRLYNSRKRYTDSGKFSTWLFTIATNLARSHARFKSRRPSVSLEALQSGKDENAISRTLAVDASPTPDVSLSSSETAEEVRQAISRLPQKKREAILLSVYEELSHEDIGRIQKCSAKAVELRLYRARKSLKEALHHLVP